MCYSRCILLWTNYVAIKIIQYYHPILLHWQFKTGPTPNKVNFIADVIMLKPFMTCIFLYSFMLFFIAFWQFTFTFVWFNGWCQNTHDQICPLYIKLKCKVLHGWVISNVSRKKHCIFSVLFRITILYISTSSPRVEYISIRWPWATPQQLFYNCRTWEDLGVIPHYRHCRALSICVWFSICEYKCKM